MPELKANFFDCVQGSPEWLKIRAGHGTSSRAASMISFLKRKSNGKDRGDETKAREDYRTDLIIERITKKCVDHYVSVHMKEGRDKEPLARTAYEMEIGQMVDRIGFVLHPEIAWCGASPDALIGKRGLAEFKCPTKRVHFEYLVGKAIPEEYIPQMMLQLACDPERDYNDFVSHHPEFPKPYRTVIYRMNRHEAKTKEGLTIASMEHEIARFLREVEDGYIRARELYEGGPSVEEIRLRQSLEARGKYPTEEDQMITEADIG